MSPRSTARLARLLLLGLMLAVCWLAFDPQPRPVATGHADKLSHALAFIALAAVARPALGGPLRAAAAMSGFGLFIELVQSFIPARSASLGDVLADLAGIALGVALARWARRAEQRRAAGDR